MLSNDSVGVWGAGRFAEYMPEKYNYQIQIKKKRMG